MRYYNFDTPEKMEAISIQQFNKFQMGAYNPINNNQMYASLYKPSPNKNKGSSLYSEFFKKSIKEDRNTYSTLREDKQWDKWNRSIKSLAYTHDYEDVFAINLEMISKLHFKRKKNSYTLSSRTKNLQIQERR